ncbi:MAG TPA: hypothetical protein VM328_08185 [Fimbriimonadaceae bacterium]|nr:hypothetical protein [Fimbriimonadaceae bacterium]
MRRFIFAVILMVPLLATASQRSPLGTTSRFLLVMSPDVKKEIKLTKEQNKKIEEAMKKMEQDAREGRMALDLSDPMAGISIDLEPILDDAQKTRLDELFVQVNGGVALTDAKVGAKLELREEQKASLKELKAELLQMTMEALPKIRSTAGVKELEKAQNAIKSKMIDLLDADQKAKFEALKGKPFKFRN